MNEQKYYVQINKKLWNNLNPLQLGGVGIDLCPSEYGYGEYFIAEYEPKSSYAKVNKNSFTKSELAEIMDGTLYVPEEHFCKYVDYSFNCHTFGCVEEWINPLIELVPVDEV